MSRHWSERQWRTARSMGVSRSGFYAWQAREPSARDVADRDLTELIRQIHATSRDSYGAPRVHAELADRGVHVGRKRVERLMKATGLAGVSRRRSARTTIRGDRVRPSADLVDRNFYADGPNQLWDETVFAIGSRTMVELHHLRPDLGWLASAMGLGPMAAPWRTWRSSSTRSRAVAIVLEPMAHHWLPVGWATGTTLKTQLVLDAMNMAIGQRRPSDVIHHSDQGSQYTSVAFGLRGKEAGVRPSMGSVGDAYDNAMCESFFAAVECELLDRRKFRTKAEAGMAIFEFIEGWYNPGRRHSALGYLSPIDYERNALETLEFPWVRTHSQ